MFRNRRSLENVPVRLIDAKGHILGKLAAVVAKQALIGNYRIVIVHAEEIIITGHKHRNFINFSSYLRKHVNTDHSKGPFHHRNPRGILLKAIRGMLPRKTSRGQEAMSRIKIFEGVPRRYEKLRCHSVPSALHYIHAKSNKFTKLTTISQRFGWKYAKVIENFEAKRKLQAQSRIKRVLKSKSLMNQALINKKEDLDSIEKRFCKFYEVSA